MSDVTDPAISLVQQPNPRRQSVLRDGVKIGTIEHVEGGWMGLVNGVPIGDGTTQPWAIKRLLDHLDR